VKIGYFEKGSKISKKKLQEIELGKDLVFIKVDKNDWNDASDFGYRKLENTINDEVVRSYMRFEKKYYFKEVTDDSFMAQFKDFSFVCHQLENVKQRCPEVQFYLIPKETNPLSPSSVSYSTKAKGKQENMLLLCHDGKLDIRIHSIEFEERNLTKTKFNSIFPEEFEKAYKKLAWSGGDKNETNNRKNWNGINDLIIHNSNKHDVFRTS